MLQLLTVSLSLLLCKLAMLLGWCDLDWALRATKPLMPGIGHASLIVFALRALLARLKGIYYIYAT